MNETLIRPETPSDAEAIRATHIAAFRDHPDSAQVEHLTVEMLRNDGALSVSLVAVRDGQLVGHVAFSEAVVGDMTDGWYMAGPMAVLPEFQNQGIGAMLLVSGFEALRARQAMGCVGVGDPRFYGRFGFAVHSGLVFQGGQDGFVLGLSFGDRAPTGEITAHRAFVIQHEKE